MAMVLAKALDNVPARLLRALLHPATFRGAVIGHAQRRECSGQRAQAGADLRATCLLGFERRSVLAHEVFAPWNAGDVARDTAATKAHATLAVTIQLIGAMLRESAFRSEHSTKPRSKNSHQCCQWLWHRPRR